MECNPGLNPTHLVLEKRRLPNLIVSQNIQIHPFLGHHKLPPTARPTAIHPVQKLLNHLLISANKILHHPVLAPELQLIPEIRQFTLRQSLRGHEGLGRRGVRRRDAEDGGDQGRVPLRDAVDGGATPVVAAEDETRDVDVAGEGGDGVGVGSEGVVL